MTFAGRGDDGADPVSVIGDTAVEPNETFQVVLSAPSGLTIADGSAAVTIVDDDTRRRLAPSRLRRRRRPPAASHRQALRVSGSCVRNVGVPAGTALTRPEASRSPADGTVIDGLDVAGTIRVNARNVTIKNTR